ncbi:hypothetical protein Acr_17g0009530 [Actinidia rufa]|uniref:RRP15-like protein n=1 Tax=Actinidia rufa TaxID=165716 RepID=A0A7J0G3M2_9ERIC|nr:hypothetical protein Acr_17g0009530 [Actinidia rufa]
MAEEAQTRETESGLRKRRMGNKKGGKAKKKLKVFQGTGEKVKIDKKMQKLFRKRAREYNSDDDDEPSTVARDGNEQSHNQNEVFDGKSSDEEGEERQNYGVGDEESEDEHGEIQPGITKFTEGCNAFRMAFKKITNKNVSDDLLGPVLSAHKKLWGEKLAQEEAEKKVKGEAKKEKHLVREKGHVKPANFLDSHEKFLIAIATKGVSVVKLFNAVNKAQNAQKGLNPSRTKDAKEVAAVAGGAGGFKNGDDGKSKGFGLVVYALDLEVFSLRRDRTGVGGGRTEGRWWVGGHGDWRKITRDPTRKRTIRKRRKEAFFSELGKTSLQTAETLTKASTSAGTVDGEGPAWAPLRDGYMLTNPKLKDWDKMQDSTVSDDVVGMSSDSSSDDD